MMLQEHGATSGAMKFFTRTIEHVFGLGCLRPVFTSFSRRKLRGMGGTYWERMFWAGTILTTEMWIWGRGVLLGSAKGFLLEVS